MDRALAARIMILSVRKPAVRKTMIAPLEWRAPSMTL